MAPPFDHLRIYATEMSTYVDGGYPLWSPEVTAKEGEVQIGDVGYIDDGVFKRLFNIIRDDAHKALPPGLKRLTDYDKYIDQGGEEENLQYLDRGPLYSKSVTEAHVHADIDV